MDIHPTKKVKAMHYTAKHDRGNIIELINERQEPIGSVNYTGKLPGKALIHMQDNELFTAMPVARDGAAAGISRNGCTYAVVQCGADQSMSFMLHTGKRFFMNRTGKWNSSYSIVDESQKEVASVRSRFQWKSLSFDYEIDVRRKVLDKDTNAAFPFLLVYCTQHARTRRAPVALGKIAASFL